MADPRDVLAQQVSAALGAAFGPEYEAADPVIRPSSFADYQSNAALPLELSGVPRMHERPRPRVRDGSADAELAAPRPGIFCRRLSSKEIQSALRNSER